MPAIILKTILPDSEALGRETAAIFARLALAAIEARDRFLVCLSGGATPLIAYQLLAKPNYKDLPWQKMVFFWGDERCVPADDPQSNFYQAYQALLSHVPVHKKNIHRIAADLPCQEALTGYAKIISQYSATQKPWPRFDLVLLGLGEDGHIASLAPDSPGLQPDSPPIIPAQFAYQDRPSERLTLTLPVFNSAREVLFLVSGANKQNALSAAWDDNSDPQQNPAKLVHPSPGRVRWLVDQAAAGEV